MKTREGSRKEPAESEGPPHCNRRADLVFWGGCEATIFPRRAWKGRGEGGGEAWHILWGIEGEFPRPSSGAREGVEDPQLF